VRKGVTARFAYSSGVIRCSQGAGQRPNSANAQAGVTVRTDSRCVHCRSGMASWKPAAASSAARREVKGPRYASSPGVSLRTTDNRGYASSVSFSQTTRSGNLDRRLYGGACAPISRSSRTSASSE